MPELDFAFLADVARIKNGVLDVLGIGFDTIGVAAFPAAHQTFLVLRVAFRQDDCGVTHRIEAVVQGPDGERLAGVSINVEATWPDEDPPGDRVTMPAAIPLVVPLAAGGDHSVDIAIDGAHAKAIGFRVVEQPVP